MSRRKWCLPAEKETRMSERDAILPEMVAAAVAAAAAAAPPSGVVALAMAALVYNETAVAVAADDLESLNLTLDEYLQTVRGPKHLPLNVVIPLTAIYVAIFVSGVVGNVAVCVVIVRNISLHTATNYYLFSLALSDLTLLLLGLPNDLSVYWQQYPWIFGEKVCKIRALVSEMTSYTSVLTIVAFSTERYLAICHPLHSYAMSGLKRALRIIACLWIISLFSAMPFAVFTSVHYVDYPPGSGSRANESAFCALLDEDLPENCPLYELSFILFFLVPMLLIIVLYGCIGMRIRKRSRHSLGKRVEGAVHGESRHMKTRKSIIRMLAAVVVTFFLCWAPFHAQRLLYLYADRSAPYYSQINEWLYYIAGCFYYFSSTVNPVLYNIMSVKYRHAFRQTLCGFKYGGYGRGWARGRGGAGAGAGAGDLHSSFHDTIIQSSHENSHSQWRRSLTWRHTSKRSLASNGAADVVVMIAPLDDGHGHGHGQRSRRRRSSAASGWRQTWLRVAMASRLAKDADADAVAVDQGELPAAPDKLGRQLETRI